MAKKKKTTEKQTTTQPPEETKKKRGQKACPNPACGKFVAARSRTCQYCKTDIPPKNQDNENRRRSAVNEIDIWRASVKKALAVKKALGDDAETAESILAAIEKAGGVEQARELLNILAEFSEGEK